MAKGVSQAVDDPGSVQGVNVANEISIDRKPPGIAQHVAHEQNRNNKAEKRLHGDEITETKNYPFVMFHIFWGNILKLFCFS